jgi:hypothetical protein
VEDVMGFVNVDKVVVTFGSCRWEVPYERMCRTGYEKEEVMITLCGADSPFADVAVPLVPARAKDLALYVKARIERIFDEYMIDAGESE